MAKKMAKPNMSGSNTTVLEKELATHLRKAEEHLIEAVKLFARKGAPERSIDFQNRLIRAQELVTWVRRDDLVRMRGLIRVTVAKK